MPNYKLFAALHQDSQQGWIWLQDARFIPRSIVKITNVENGKVIYCEALQIDQNFLSVYNHSPRFSISDPHSAIVINGWYRARLGAQSTQSDAQLEISPCNSLRGKFNACTNHPQVVVRVAAWMGGVGLLLGVIGLVLGLLSFLPRS